MILGSCSRLRSCYLVQRAPTLSTFEKPPAKAVFSFLAHRVALIRLIDQRFLVRTTAKKYSYIQYYPDRIVETEIRGLSFMGHKLQHTHSDLQLARGGLKPSGGKIYHPLIQPSCICEFSQQIHFEDGKHNICLRKISLID